MADRAGGASAAQRAIRASRAVRARRDYGLVAQEGHQAAFQAWRAWQRGAAPQRRDLEPLAALEPLWEAACGELAPVEG